LSSTVGVSTPDEFGLACKMSSVDVRFPVLGEPPGLVRVLGLKSRGKLPSEIVSQHRVGIDELVLEIPPRKLVRQCLVEGVLSP